MTYYHLFGSAGWVLVTIQSLRRLWKELLIFVQMIRTLKYCPGLDFQIYLFVLQLLEAEPLHDYNHIFDVRVIYPPYWNRLNNRYIEIFYVRVKSIVTLLGDSNCISYTHISVVLSNVPAPLIYISFSFSWLFFRFFQNFCFIAGQLIYVIHHTITGSRTFWHNTVLWFWFGTTFRWKIFVLVTVIKTFLFFFYFTFFTVGIGCMPDNW